MTKSDIIKNQKNFKDCTIFDFSKHTVINKTRSRFGNKDRRITGHKPNIKGERQDERRCYRKPVG